MSRGRNNKSKTEDTMKNMEKQFLKKYRPILISYCSLLRYLNYTVKWLRETHFMKTGLSEIMPLWVSVSGIVHLHMSSPAGIQGVMMPATWFQGLVSSFDHFNDFLSSVFDSWSHSTTKSLARVVDCLGHKPITRINLNK